MARPPRIRSLDDARERLRHGDAPDWEALWEFERVVAGELFDPDTRRYGVQVWPVDDPPAVADFVARIWIPDNVGEILRRGECAIWLAYGELRRNTDGFIGLATLGIGPGVGGDRGITSEVMRAIKPSQLLREARADLAKKASWLEAQAAGFELSDPLAGIAEQSASVLERTTPRARGRAPLPPDFYFQIAREFLGVQDDEQRRDGVYRVLARRHGKPIETIRTWVRKAQREGFLSSGLRGKRAQRERGPRYYEFEQKGETT